MENRLCPWVLALFLALPQAAWSQTAHLVKDIIPGSHELAGSFPDSMWSVQGKVIFTAEEPSSGRELWVTDGNSSGPRLLTDFCPGTCSSAPLPLGTAHSLLFGIASVENTFSSNFAHLWRSDGTRQGTFLLPGLVPIIESSFDNPQASIAFGADNAYFGACEPERSKCSLWRTDGTATGTVELKEIPDGNAPSELTFAGGRLFFVSAWQLWTSDGTPEGTTAIRQFPNSVPRHLAALGN